MKDSTKSFPDAWQTFLRFVENMEITIKYGL